MSLSSLLGRLAAHCETPGLDMPVKTAALGKNKLLRFLGRLEDSLLDYVTFYASPLSLLALTSQPETESTDFAPEIRAALREPAVAQELERYGTGAVVLWSERECSFIVIPPFAVLEDGVFRGRPETLPLRRLMQEERLLGVVLVTWGSYGVGVFQGDRLLKSKIGTGYIHKRHRKGGRSEKRFARRTEEQKKDFLRKVANRVDETFEGYRPEQVFFGGNRLVLKPLAEESSYLRSQGQWISKRFLNVRSANKDVLVTVLEDIHRSMVFNLGGGRTPNENKL